MARCHAGQELNRQAEQQRVFEQTREDLRSSKAPYLAGSAASPVTADAAAPDAELQDDGGGQAWLTPEDDNGPAGDGDEWGGPPEGDRGERAGDQPPQQTVFLDEVYPEGYDEIFDRNLNDLPPEAIRQVSLLLSVFLAISDLISIEYRCFMVHLNQFDVIFFLRTLFFY